MLLSVSPTKLQVRSREGETVTGTYVLKNMSNEPVTVLGAQTSCGCMVPEGLPLELPPGGSGNLTVVIKVGPAGAMGSFKQSAVLFVNREGYVPPLVIEAMLARTP